MAQWYRWLLVLLAVIVAGISRPAIGGTVSFQASDFTVSPIFSNVQTFDFSIDLSGALVAGSVYTNPALTQVDYSVSGTLSSTPSGFPAFNLVRAIGGLEFYTQGSSLSFEISASADLSDGLQVAELVGSTNVLVFNGREVGTGRYHPALFLLHADGTGSIRNSNNMGGINPGSGMVVDVDFGEEYITNLTFDPSALTIAIPEPSSISLLTIAGLACYVGRVRGKSFRWRDGSLDRVDDQPLEERF